MSTNIMWPKEIVHLGLVRRINVGITDGKGGEAKYWPICDERYFPKPKNRSIMDFENWWQSEEIFKYDSYSLTRRDLILSVANKDGGPL